MANLRTRQPKFAEFLQTIRAIAGGNRKQVPRFLGDLHLRSDANCYSIVQISFSIIFQVFSTYSRPVRSNVSDNIGFDTARSDASESRSRGFDPSKSKDTVHGSRGVDTGRSHVSGLSDAGLRSSECLKAVADSVEDRNRNEHRITAREPSLIGNFKSLVIARSGIGLNWRPRYLRQPDK